MRNDIVIEVIDKIKSGKPILVMQAILTGIEAKSYRVDMFSVRNS